MSVVHFHTMTASFVQQAARSLYEAGQLERFVTTVRYDPDKVSQRATFAVGRLLGMDLERQFRRRAITEIPTHLVEAHPFAELVRLGVSRIDRDRRATDFVWQRATHAFDRRVASSLRSNTGGVYGYEYVSLATLRRADELGIPSAYDVPAPEPDFVHSILDRELEKFPELITPWHRWTAKREPERTIRRHTEFGLANVVIANSRFTRDSFQTSGLDIAKVQVVPLGAPPPIPRDEALSGGSAPDHPLQLLWSGTFGIRKGAHILLDAWRRHNLGRLARLRVHGAVALPDRVLKPLPEGVEIVGSVPHGEMMEAFRNADALVFPTLCDGFGMVVNEAWSRGVPVITTRSAGASELLHDRRDGLLIEAGSPDAIASAIEWCHTHRAELRAMREQAHATASGWQWSDFRRRLAEVLSAAGLFRKTE